MNKHSTPTLQSICPVFCSSSGRVGPENNVRAGQAYSEIILKIENDLHNS